MKTWPASATPARPRGVHSNGWDPVEESTQIDIENFVIRSTLWGFFDPSAARRLGYHYPAPGPSLEGVKYGPISEAQVTECIRSLDEAFPGGRSWEGLIGTGGLPGGGPASRIEDSRYLAAAAKWSACMKIRGFAAQQPLQLLSDPRWNTPTPTPEEIATATADVDCKIEISGVLVDTPTPDGHNRRQDWRKAKGTVVLGSEAPAPLDPAVEYLLVLEGQLECRVRARRRQKSHTYDVEGAVTKPPA